MNPCVEDPIVLVSEISPSSKDSSLTEGLLVALLRDCLVEKERSEELTEEALVCFLGGGELFTVSDSVRTAIGIEAEALEGESTGP